MSNFVFDENIICPEDITATKERVEQYKDYYAIKYNICKKKDPKKIAEIGVRAGYSAWTFLQACPEAKYYGFDANNGTHGGQGGEDGKYSIWAKKILKNYEVEIINIDTQKTNDLDISNIDLFHIDGDHTEQGVMHDLDLAFSCINKSGLILIDDVTFLESVKNGVEKWINKNNDIVFFEYIESLRGECLIRKKNK